MSNNRFVFEGLEELKAELRALPAELAGEGTGIVMDAATGAKAAVAAIYAANSVSGELAKGLSLRVESIGPFGTRAIVKSNGRLASIFENGSEARHYITVRGNRHETGKMPPAHVFIPAMIRFRYAMYQKHAAMLERHGLKVTGDASGLAMAA